MIDVQAKITPANQSVATGQSVEVTSNTVTVAPGDNIALNLQPDAVSGYAREGSDMLVQLKNGEVLRVANFYAAPNNPAHLFLVDGAEQLVAVELPANAIEGALAAAYAPQGVAAEFAAGAAGVAEGAAGVGAAAAAGGGGISTAAAVLGGVALVGGGVGLAASGGGGEDTPEPPVPPVDTTPPGPATNLAVNAAGTQITGTAEAGATVRIDTNGDGTPDITVTAGADGRFTAPLDPPLVDGQTITVTVRDAAGNTSTAATVTAPDTTAPPAATEVVVSADGTTITGQATPGATVRIDVDGDGTPDYTTIAGNDGAFSVPVSPPLLDGETVSVTVADAAGNVSAPATATAPDTTAPPAATQVAVSADGATITGQATPGATVRIDVDGDGTPDYTTTAGDDGAFSVPVSPPLLDGETVSVIVADAAGNASAAVTATAPDTTAPPAATQVAVSADGTTITGQATPGSTVRIDVNGDGTPDYTTTAGDDGAFSVPVSPPLLDGETVSVIVADAAGNASAAVTATAPDTTAPPAATQVAVSPDGTTITGQATPGSTVRIDVNGDGTPDYTTTAGGNGAFSVPVSPPLLDGETVSVTVADAAGNASAAVTATAPDTTAPPAATQVAVSADGTTITGQATPGSTVRIDINGDGTPDYTTTAGGNGAFSVPVSPPLLDGETVSVTVADAAGNASAAVTATAPDTTAPPAATQVAVSADGTTITGQATPGSTVRIDVNGDGTPDYTTTAGGNGAFSVPVSPPLLDGETVSVTVADAAGNASAAATATAPDTTAPPAATQVAVSADGATITGQATPGSTVRIDVNGDGTPDYTTTAGGNGAFSVPVSPPLLDGETVSVIVADAAGNASAAVTATAPDTTAPPAATQVAVSADGATITGQATPGSTVRIDINGDGTSDYTTTAGGNGAFSVPVSPPLLDGETVSVRVVDGAGNVSAPATATAPDTTLPAAATDLAISPDGTTLTGLAEAGATVNVDSNGDGTPDYTGTAGIDGRFTITLAPPLIDGETASVTVVDPAGNTGPAATTVAPDLVPNPNAPTIDPTDGTVVTGTADPNVTIQLFGENGLLLGETRSDANGDWTITPRFFIRNAARIRVVAVNSEGEASGSVVVQVDSVAPAAPDITTGNGTTIGGTAEPGATVTVSLGATVIGTTVADSNGNWSIPTQGGVVNGSIVTAIATDSTGNDSVTGTITIDAAPPAAPIVTPSNGSVLTGTAEPASTVTLTAADGSVIATVIVDDLGGWSYVPVPPLTDGTSVTVTATDPAGNVGTGTTVTVDSTPPATPVLVPTNGDVISGTSDPNVTVTLSVVGPNGTVAETQVTADINGNWFYDPAGSLPHGTVVQAVAADAAGNLSGAAAVTVDSVPPSIPVVQPTNGASLSGTAEAGATIIVTGPSGTVGTTVANPDGTWTVTPTTAPGNGVTLTVTARDPSGNDSPAANVTVDAIAPDQPILAPTNGNVIVGIVFSGSGGLEVNALVTIFANGLEIGTVRTDAQGNFTFDPPGTLPNGTVVTAIAQDAAGNESATGSVTTDGSFPSIPLLNASNGVAIGGLADPNTTIIVTDAAGVEIFRTFTTPTGVWNVVFPTPIGDGVTLRAIAENALGTQSAAATVITDAVPPPAPVIDPSNGATVTGTAEAGTTVLIFRDASGGPLIGSAVADANGRWTFTPGTPLADGTALFAQARDAANNLSTEAQAVVDASAPPAPVIAASNGVSIAGTAEANAVVVLTLTDGTVVGTVTADALGNWSSVLTPALANGVVVNATARDIAGNTGPAGSVTIDAVAPGTPTVTPSNGVTLTGTGEIGATIVVTIGTGLPLGTAVVDANGNWTLTPGTPFANGTAVQVRAIDAAGNVSGAVGLVIDSFAPPIPVIVPTMGATLSGTAEPGVTVVLRDGAGNAIGQVTADANGAWSFTPGAPLANGTVVLAYAIDAAGNTSSDGTVTVDNVAPGVPVIAPSNGGLLSGTGEVGATITLRLLPDGTVLGTALVAADGSWSLVVNPALANGTQVSATATDPTGNVSGPASVTIDALAPNTPTVGVSDGTVLSGTSDADVIIILQEGGGVLGTATPDANGNWTFTPSTPLVNGSVVTVVASDPSGNVSSAVAVTVDSIAPAAPVVALTNGTVIAGTAEAGATITLTNGAGNPIGTTTANANGAWSFTPGTAVANATVVNVTASDAAGNVSTIATVTVDAAAPGLPTVAPSQGGVLTGTAEAGATITLTGADGTVIGTTTADVGGNWSFAPGSALANGTVVTVIASDAVGNASVAASVTIDSVAPGAPVLAPSNGATISGTAEAAAAITLTDNLGNPIGTTTADLNGNWSVTPGTAVPNGTIVLAVATDRSGNVSVAGAVTVDSVAPGQPTVNPSNGLALAGTAEANATVTLTGPGGAPIGTTTADANGNWSFTPGSQLANALVVNVIATDATGNASGAASVTIDSVAPGAPVLGPTNGTHVVGTAEAGALVTISAGGSPLATVTADANGNFAYVPGTPIGSGVVVSATATDVSGNVSGPGTVTINTALPSTPVINPSNGVLVTGRADVGDTLTLTANGVVIGMLTVGAGGTWSVTPPTPLPDGTVLVAVARNPAGTDSTPVNTLVDGLAPAVPVIQLSTAAALSGTAEAGATVTLQVGGGTIGTVVADANGNWTFNPGTPLANGVVVSISASDAAGNASGPVTVTIDALAPGAPILNPSSGGILAGTAEAGALVTLSVGGVGIGTVQADINGNWAFTPVPALGNGVVVSATATDASGNVGVAGTVTIDTIAPGVATGLQVSADGTALTGVAEIGAQVRVIIDGNTANPLFATVGAGGTFTLPLSPPLLAGQDLAVVVIDPAGNTSGPVIVEAPDRAPLTLTVAEAADGYVNAAEMGDGVQVRVGLTAGTDAGDTITVRFNGPNGYVANYAHVVTAAERAAGAFNLTLTPPQGQSAFPQGAATISATSSDGPVSNNVSFTVDTVPPATPILSLVGNILTISGEPNSLLTVQVNVGGVNATVQVQANNSGLASVNLLTDLSVGLDWNQLLNTSVSVRGQDAAGNVSNVATIGINPQLDLVTVDSFGLNVALIPPTLGFSGHTEPGSSVRVEVVTPAITAIVAPAVDANGNFAVNLLSPQVASQLGLSLTGLLNLGAGLGFNIITTDADGHQSATYGVSLTGSGLSLNIGQVTITGDTGDNIMGGTTGVAEILNGLGGADLILNVGTGDRVDAGTGDDTIQLTATNFTSLNGGNGFDTVVLANGIDINYGSAGIGTISNVERIDLGRGDSGSDLRLTSAQVDAVTDAGNVLQITGEANDRLFITGAVDTGTTTTLDGLLYHVYNFGNTTVLVEDNSVTVVI